MIDKNEKPLISVLMPVYNVRDYVLDALNSILTQTYERIELIIIDDHSNDGTYEIIKKLTAGNKNVKLIRNQKNLKIAMSLNEGLKLATGSYIARMDGDDISDHERLEKYLREIEENPNIDLIGSSVISIDESGAEIGRAEFYEDFKLIKKTLKYRTPCAHIWLAKRQVYDALGGYRSIPGAEDYDFLLRAISYGFRISNLEKYYGYKVRIFRNGNTLSHIGLKQRLMHRYIYELYLERLSGKPDSLSPESLAQATRVGEFENFLFKISSAFLKKSIQHKASGAIFQSTLYAIASCISPHQASYLVDRMVLKFKVQTLR